MEESQRASEEKLTLITLVKNIFIQEGSIDYRCKIMTPEEYVKAIKKYDENAPIKLESWSNGKTKQSKIVQTYKEHQQVDESQSQKKFEINFINEKLDGLITCWDNSGNKIWEDTYKSGVLNGLSIDWANDDEYEYDSEKKDIELNYLNGCLHGVCTGWDYGKIVVEEVYEKGVLVSTKEYISDGEYDEYTYGNEGSYKDGVYIVEAKDSKKIDNVMSVDRDRNDIILYLL